MSSIRKNISSQNLTFCLVNATTGAALTGASVTVKVSKDGSQGAGGGSVTELGSGQYNYAPSQADTNAVNVGFLFTATNAIPVNMNYYTDISGAAGYVGIDWSNINAPTTSVALTGTTISSSQIAASVTAGVTVTTNNDKTGYSLSASQTFSLTGNITGNLSGSVGSVTGAVGSVTGFTASDVGAIKTQTDKMAFTVTNQIDANIQYVNDVQVKGVGTSGNPWNPV